MSQQSLADLAVQALAAVKAMDAQMTNDRPERHQVRTLRRLAEAHLETAFRQAIELAYVAKDLDALVADITAPTAQKGD